MATSTYIRKNLREFKVRRKQADIGIEKVGVEGGGVDDDIKELYQIFTQNEPKRI